MLDKMFVLLINLTSHGLALALLNHAKLKINYIMHGLNLGELIPKVFITQNANLTVASLGN